VNRNNLWVPKSRKKPVRKKSPQKFLNEIRGRLKNGESKWKRVKKKWQANRQESPKKWFSRFTTSEQLKRTLGFFEKLKSAFTFFHG